jgi:hypothetical protein
MSFNPDATPTVDFTPRHAIARRHVQPILWGLSLIPWQAAASRFNYALAYGAMLSECRIGQGRVVVSNLWILDWLRRGYPEAGYLLDCLVSYLAGEAADANLPALGADAARVLFRVEPR